MPFSISRLAAAAASLCCLSPCLAQQVVAAVPPVIVKGNYDNAVGTSDAASEGRVTAKLIQSRPTLRTAEVLEFVPGMIVSQHSGDGKANQYYLRGFNLDHGTDFASFVDGMPVNMPTHAHGQGYSDLNFLIPELVRGIDYRKGPYAAEDGDFASAGSARIHLVDRLPRGMGSVTVGENGYVRAMAADSSALSAGHLLYAADAAHHDGPWDLKENFRRFNGLLRYSLNEGDARHTLTAMAYTAKWRSTDQVPQRAVDQGLIGRYGAIDTSDHGETRRASLSWNWLKSVDDGEWRANAYAINSHLDLFSNFTYYIDDTNGDQFEQAEDRRVFGGGVSRLWQGELAGHASRNTLGLQWRHDRLDPVGLYTAVGGARNAATQESRVRESSVGIHAQNDTRWTPWLRSVAGLRGDRYEVDVDSSVAANSGDRGAWIASPKFSLILGPWSDTEFFVNTGHGFHSNDARGMTARVQAADPSQETRPAVPLVRTRGSELGLRGEWLPGLQTSVSLWRLKLGSELVFVGDAGETEESGASTRRGIEINNHYVARPWLLFDLDVALSQARFARDQGEPGSMGRHVPGSAGRVVSFGATVADRGPWFGQFQVRHFGPRPLLEDNSQRSRGTTLAYARVGYRLSLDWKLSLDVFNLFDRKVSDIDYYYASRLRGETDPETNDIHSHPAEPRTVRLTVSASF